MNMKITNEKLEEIINLFCVVDPRPYPDGTGVWGKDTEIFSTDEEQTGLSKARVAIREILSDMI